MNNERSSQQDVVTYEEAWAEAVANIERALCAPDRPNDEEVGIDALRALLPIASKSGLTHNYRYRERTMTNEYNSRVNQHRKSIHGGDGYELPEIEIKTGSFKRGSTVSGRIITDRACMGTFDKIHTRVGNLVCLDRKEALEACEAYLLDADTSGEESGVMVCGETVLDNPSAIRALKNFVDDSSKEDESFVWGTKLDLTSSEKVQVVDFGLFVSGGVDSLITVSTTTQALSEHLNDHFTKAYLNYKKVMKNRPNRDRKEKAPSARDDALIRLQDLLRIPPNLARVVKIDFPQLWKQDIRLSLELAQTLLDEHRCLPEFHKRLAEEVKLAKETKNEQSRLIFRPDVEQNKRKAFRR